MVDEHNLRGQRRGRRDLVVDPVVGPARVQEAVDPVGSPPPRNTTPAVLLSHPLVAKEDPSGYPPSILHCMNIHVKG